VRQPVNIVSHFARADEPDCATERQLDIFTTFSDGKPGQRSIAASGGTLLWPQAHFDWVRASFCMVCRRSIAIHGDFGFQPAMTLTSSLIAVREHKAGDAVGYGGTWVSERDTRLGVVAMGYGDGYPRAAVRYAGAGQRSRSPDCWSGGDGYDLRRFGPDAQDAVGDSVVFWGKVCPSSALRKSPGSVPMN
jgi:alanine racemase